MTMELVSSSSLIVHDFSNKKAKKLYPNLNFISHFIRNKSDLKLKAFFYMRDTTVYLLVCYLY